MRGNLPALGRMLAVLCDDLNYAGATQAEQDAALVMSALHAAIVLDKTGELAELVAPWWADNVRAAAGKLLERRTDTLAQARRDAEARRREDARSLEDAPLTDSEL